MPLKHFIPVVPIVDVQEKYTGAICLFGVLSPNDGNTGAYCQTKCEEPEGL